MDLIKKILSFIIRSKKEEVVSVEQTGVLFDRRDTDYTAGTLPFEVRVKDGDWSKYEPLKERQNSPFLFDTMACTSFSFLNVIETQLNYLNKNNLLSKYHIAFLLLAGYLKESTNQVNFSDRALAILSNTTNKGNTFIKVVDTARNIGLIPQDMLDYGNVKTFEEWHNPKLITKEMMARAKQFLEYFSISYEWIYFIDTSRTALTDHLKHAPLQISIPVPGKHAVMLSSYSISTQQYRIFNTYPPYSEPKNIDKPISYAMKVIITPKEIKPGQITRVLRLGDMGEDVKKIQSKLKITIDGMFGNKMLRAVIDLQKKKGLTMDGIIGPKTLKAILENEITLVEALIQVESQGNDRAIGDVNLPDKAYGPLQIRRPCVDDVNKVFKTSYKPQDMLGDRNLSIWVFERYMELYATEKKLGRPVTDEDRARIWNGGPMAWKKPNKSQKIETMLSNYWDKVSKLL